MNKPKDGGLAFPFIEGNYCGMSLRDWFAGMALMGICANPDISLEIAKAQLSRDDTRKAFAEGAYKEADAMLAAREK